jgi:hypothetical protein
MNLKRDLFTTLVVSSTISVISPLSVSAATHTWAPAPSVLSTGCSDCVPITGSRIIWGAGTFDLGFPDASMSMTSPGSVSSFTLTMLDFQAKLSLIKLARVCDNPFLTADQKTITSESGVEQRWLVATSMATMVVAQSIGWYDKAVAVINLIVGNMSLKGFKVWYKDGFSETWLFVPNYPWASIKLFDQPAPESLKPDGAGC